MPWGRVNSPGQESSFPLTGWKRSSPEGCGKLPQFPTEAGATGMVFSEPVIVCTEQMWGEREGGQRWERRARGPEEAGERRKTEAKPLKLEVAGFLCIILSICDRELAPCLRSWIQGVGPLLPLSFFHHSKDDTWHSGLTSAHAFVLFFPTLFYSGVWHEGLRFESDTPAVPSMPTPPELSWNPSCCHDPLWFPLRRVWGSLLFWHGIMHLALHAPQQSSWIFFWFNKCNLQALT